MPRCALLCLLSSVLCLLAPDCARRATAASDNNHTGWKDPACDALLREAARTADAAARLALLQRAEALLLAGMPIVPICHLTTVRLMHPAVRGWYPTPLDRHPYQHVCLEI